MALTSENLGQYGGNARWQEDAKIHLPPLVEETEVCSISIDYSRLTESGATY